MENLYPWNVPTGTHVLYALTDDPDYLVWDMDLFTRTRRAILGGAVKIEEYTPVAIIPVTLRWNEDGWWEGPMGNQDILLAHLLEAQATE